MANVFIRAARLAHERRLQSGALFEVDPQGSSVFRFQDWFTVDSRGDGYSVDEYVITLCLAGAMCESGDI